MHLTPTARRPPENETGPTRTVRFSGFEVDLASGELRKDGARVKLQEQPFQVLRRLLRHPGEVVMRSELRDLLWADGTFVDFEHGLNAAIKRLRVALGDSAETPRFVETLHRRGYRFIASVDGDEGSPHASVVPRGSAPTDRPPQPVHPESPDASSGRTRLAVLPFDNLSVDPDQDYFSTGLAEEMIERLGRLAPERLGVIARTSAASVVRQGCTVEEIGRTLQVRYLVEGSVRRSGDRIRISARLVDVRDQTCLWSNTYERRLEDYFALQSEVAGHVAASLAVELLPPARDRAAGTANVDAYQAYLRGRFHWNKGTIDGYRRAVTCFEQAVSLAPGFARAHAALARARVHLVEYVHEPAWELLEQARQSAERALDLDAGVSWAYLARASVRKRLDWNWDGAGQDYATAVALNPNGEEGHRAYAEFSASMNRRAEAQTAIACALELDPLCLVINTSQAWIHLLARRETACIATCRHVLDMDPTFARGYRLLGQALIAAGQPDEGLDALARAVDLEQREPVELACLALGFAAAGRRDQARRLMSELERLARTRYVSAVRLALIHSALGDSDRAFAALDRACDERAMGLATLAADPQFDALRPDLRFGVLLRRLGLDRAAGVASH